MCKRCNYFSVSILTSSIHTFTRMFFSMIQYLAIIPLQEFPGLKRGTCRWYTFMGLCKCNDWSTWGYKEPIPCPTLWKLWGVFTVPELPAGIGQRLHWNCISLWLISVSFLSLPQVFIPQTLLINFLDAIFHLRICILEILVCSPSWDHFLIICSRTMS